MAPLVSRTFIALFVAVSCLKHERQTFALDLVKGRQRQQNEQGLCPELYDPVYGTLIGTEFPSRCVALREGYARANADSNESNQTEFENFCYARIDGYLRSDCDKKLEA
jgi:hypothetical protein